MKLLIVDDEYFAVQGVLNGVNWETLGFEEILEAYSYTEAVDIFQKNFVEVLLCDIEMPDESGLELVAWVNEHSPSTVCIILSCHDEFDYARQALSLKCMEYVLKPVRYTALTEILKKAMDTVESNRHKEMMEQYGEQYIASVSQKTRGENQDAVEEVERYINEHLAEDLSVRDLANMVYISSDHLTRLFKKRHGKTVSDFILEKRMNLAGELLKEPNLTITMISDAVGFGNYSYFTEQFKKTYGMTPREYQKQFRG
jgi:YesN/AraC family two-component response regulator